ncbi:MAG: methylmalonyl-CoA epimerase [Calditrichaeota bacterium]|nr:methylmalonyl-CoA epimerase [Calditrichota bacterium]
MKINKIDHIGVAVNNVAETKALLERLFQLKLEFSQLVADQKVNTVGFDIAGTNLELLEATDNDSPIHKFIEKRGQGIHHIALQVDDLDASLDELKQMNVQLIDQRPRIGAEDKRIAFIHPKATGGILVELSESKK